MYHTSRQRYTIHANSIIMYVCQFEKVYFKKGFEGRETKLMLQMSCGWERFKDMGQSG